MQKINLDVDVAAMFDKNGKIRPIKFRFAMPDEQEIEVKVNRLKGIKTVKEKERAHIDFLCESDFDNIKKEYVLRYEARGLKWVLYYM